MPNLFKCELCEKLIVYHRFDSQPYKVFQHVASHNDQKYYEKVKAQFNGGESKTD